MSDIDEKKARQARDAQMVIDRLGGPSAAGRLLNIAPPSICAWRRNGIARGWVKLFQETRPEVLAGTQWEGGVYTHPRMKVEPTQEES